MVATPLSSKSCAFVDKGSASTQVSLRHCKTPLSIRSERIQPAPQGVVGMDDSHVVSDFTVVLVSSAVSNARTRNIMVKWAVSLEVVVCICLLSFMERL